MSVDGGVAFAGLPKSEWQKLVTPDENNRILLGLNQLLIRGNGLCMLIDTGLGSKIRPRRRQLMGIRQHAGIEQRLQQFGLSSKEVTHVVFTHLHYDHSGGATCASEDDSEIIPAFKNAQYLVQKAEWNAACRPDAISRAAYFPHDFLPLSQSRQLHLLTGDFEPADGIFIEVTGGHTAAHQLVRVEDDDFTVVFPGDICPTPWHLNPETREAFDLYPCETQQVRRSLVAQAIKEQQLLVFSHGLTPDFHLISESPDRPEVKIFS